MEKGHLIRHMPVTSRSESKSWTRHWNVILYCDSGCQCSYLGVVKRAPRSLWMEARLQKGTIMRISVFICYSWSSIVPVSLPQFFSDPSSTAGPLYLILEWMLCLKMMSSRPLTFLSFISFEFKTFSGRNRCGINRRSRKLIALITVIYESVSRSCVSDAIKIYA